MFFFPEDEHEELLLRVDSSDHAATLCLMSGDRAAFTDERRPDVPLELLQAVESSDPALTTLNVNEFTDAKCRALARALSHNTCISSLNLCFNPIGPAAACLIFPAMTRLTGLTRLDLSGTGLNPSCAPALCSALTHLTALTYLNLEGSDLLNPSCASDVCSAIVHLTALTYLNLQHEFASRMYSEVSHICSAVKHLTGLTALELDSSSEDDIARICGAAVAAGMVRLKELKLYRLHPDLYDVYDPNVIVKAVVQCRAWRQLPLRPTPYHVAQKCFGNYDFAPLVSYHLGLLRCTMSLVLNAAAACSILGPRSSVHYLQPPVQLRFAPSLHWLEVASQWPCCNCNKERLQLLSVCAQLSFVAPRLACADGRRVYHRRKIEDRIIAHIIKRCLCVCALLFWTSASDNCDRKGPAQKHFPAGLKRSWWHDDDDANCGRDQGAT
jgi:hypothetical protein